MKTTVGNILGLIREGRADPRIREIAVRVIRSADIAETDYHNIITAMAKFVRQNVRFVRDPPRMDQVFSPLEVLDLGGADCLTGETEIICFKDGFYTIKKISDPTILDYQALSYNFEQQKFEFKTILNWWNKGLKEIYEVFLYNGTSFKCTYNHKLYNIHRWTKEFELERVSKIEESIKRVKHKSYHNQIAIIRKIPNLEYLSGISEEKLWIFGHYLAEGWERLATRYHHQVSISGKVKKVTSKLKTLGVPFSVREKGTSSYVTLLSSPFKKEVMKFGSNSFDKSIPEEYLSLPRKKILALLNGYIEGDSYLNPKRGSQRYCRLIHQTSSDNLCKQLKLIHWILGRPLYTWYQTNHQGFGNHPIWRLYEQQRANYNREVFKDISKVGIKKVVARTKEAVYDIEVADNHNFILAWSGVIVHNCEDHTVLAASLLESIGLPVAVIIVSKTGRLWDHVFLRAGYPPIKPVNSVSVDTTIFPPSGREIPYVDQRIYEVR